MLWGEIFQANCCANWGLFKCEIKSIYRVHAEKRIAVIKLYCVDFNTLNKLTYYHTNLQVWIILCLKLNVTYRQERPYLRNER